MIRGHSRWWIGLAISLVALVVAASLASDIYTAILWYESVGYEDVFWKRIGITALVRLVAGALAMAFVLLNLWAVAKEVGPVHLRRRYGNLEIAEQVPRKWIAAGIILTALLAGWWISALAFGDGAALAVAAWLRQVPWGVADPHFGRDIAFYVFTLPVLSRATEFALLAILWTLALVVAGYALIGTARIRDGRLELEDGVRLHLVVLAATLIVLLGVRLWLDRYSLVVAGNGIGGALGYTDVHVRMPIRVGLSLLCMAAASAMVYGTRLRSWFTPAVAIGVLLLGLLVPGYLLPYLVQRFQVEPNELERESQYISQNLTFTRLAFGVEDLERRMFEYRSVSLPSAESLEPIFRELPLWDRAQLQLAYNQRQSLFPYYSFADVEFDRYGPPGERRQVAISAREFISRGVPEGSRTWQSLRLNPSYVRGMGTVVSPVADRSPQGEPVFWVSDVNPVRYAASAPPELAIEQPSIFFGETMEGYAIIIPGRDGEFGGEPDVSYPDGIRLDSFLRVLAFAWRFGEENILLSGEITPESRIIFRRTVQERVREVAPFLVWGSDVYPVISQGRLVWIVEGYSVSSRFPLARPYQLEGGGAVRYIRNSAKAVVDAVSGDFRIYSTDAEEPVVATYSRIFPDLIRPVEDMPEDIRSHLRYPRLLLHTQAAILQEYHAQDVDDFYTGRDVWQLPGEATRPGAVRSYHADYTTMPLPGASEPEFLLTVPFTARERQNMTAMLYARSDPPNYGELLLLELPRDQLIPGPEQVQALVEQDPVISSRLSLLRQSGSNVDLGQTRIVPLDGSFLYVQPVFLAAEDAERQIPELEEVVLSDGEGVVMAPSVDAALAGLRGGQESEGGETTAAGRDGLADRAGWSDRALDLLLQAEDKLRTGDWAGFGSDWEELKEVLEEAPRAGSQ